MKIPFLVHIGPEMKHDEKFIYQKIRFYIMVLKLSLYAFDATENYKNIANLSAHNLREYCKDKVNYKCHSGSKRREEILR